MSRIFHPCIFDRPVFSCLAFSVAPAEPPAGSRGRARGQEVRGAKPPWSWKHFRAAGKFSLFPKMSFRTSLHATKSLTTADCRVIDAIQKVVMNGLWIYQQQRIYLTENSMLSYVPVVSELGAECMPPNSVIGGTCAPTLVSLLRRLWLYHRHSCMSSYHSARRAHTKDYCRL